MILGMSIQSFTILHVMVSLFAFICGLLMAWFGMLRAHLLPRTIGAFFATIVATIVTGFCFSTPGLDPAKIVGILSSLVVAAALWAYYVRHLEYGWRSVFIVGSFSAMYLHAFVGVAQAFQKIPLLKATSQPSPLFLVAQVALLGLAVYGSAVTIRRFHQADQTQNRIGRTTSNRWPAREA